MEVHERRPEERLQEDGAERVAEAIEPRREEAGVEQRQRERGWEQSQETPGHELQFS